MAFGGLGFRGAGLLFSGVDVLSGWEPESGSWVERGVGRGEGAATTYSSSALGAKIVNCGQAGRVKISREELDWSGEGSEGVTREGSGFLEFL